MGGEWRSQATVDRPLRDLRSPPATQPRELRALGDSRQALGAMNE